MTIANLLLINAAVITLTMFSLWLVSLKLRDASIVDIFWGLGFVSIAIVTFLLVGSDVRDVVILVMTSLWGVRLSVYLAWRNHGRGEDPRYVAMREYRGSSFWWISLLTVFGLQGVVMWLVSLPVQVGQVDVVTLGPVAWIGMAIWLVGFLFEAVGDYQLACFKSNDSSRGRVMDRGLWKYTRHPNYFGNALIWWGIFLVAVTPSTAWLVVSPILMTYLLLKVSGVALLERSLAGRSQEYRDYIGRTSAFIPWPPKRIG